MSKSSRIGHWNTLEIVGMFFGLAACGGGCATMSRSLALGAGTGAGLGTAVGVAANSQSTAGIMTGALLGAATGGVVGYFIHQDQESRRTEISLRRSQQDDKMPLLKNVETRRVWVPAKIEGKKYVHGHYVDIIEQESQWGSSDE
jgi:hypothetical protein